MAFPDSFRTARLAAERLTAAHWDVIRALDADPQHMALLGGSRDETQSTAYMVWNLKHWEDHGFGLWILRDAADGTVAGRGAIRHLDVEGTDEVELGYGFYPRFWGRGLATEIARAFLDYGRETLHFPSLVAITRHANVGSQRVLIKTGLVYERDVDHEGVPHLLFRST